MVPHSSERKYSNCELEKYTYCHKISIHNSELYLTIENLLHFIAMQSMCCEARVRGKKKNF